MRFIHFTALLLGFLSAVPCQADWLLVGETDQTILILDNDTISYAAEDDKNNRIAVLVNVLKAPAKEFESTTAASGKEVKQVLRSMQFDCKLKKSRIVTGELLDDDLNTIGEINSTALATPLKDTLTQKELTAVCGFDLDHHADQQKPVAKQTNAIQA